MGILARMVGPHDAQDAWQETWFAVWRLRSRLRPHTDPWPLVRRIAVRKGLDVLRRRGSEPREGLKEEPAVSGRPPAVDLSRIPPNERLSIVLYFFGGLSVREVSTELGVPVATVKTWMFRGRRRLREQMKREEQNHEL